MADAAQNIFSIFQALLNHIQFIHDQLKGNKGENVPPGFTLEEFWSKLSDASKLLSHETTKVGVAFSKPPCPSQQEAQELAQALDSACMTLATIAASLPAERGAILFSEVQNASLSVISALMVVIVSIRDTRDKGQSDRLPLTGAVWEACEQLCGNLPKDNLQAVGRRLQRDELLVVDALQEVEEVLGLVVLCAPECRAAKCLQELRRAGHGDCADAGMLDAGIGLVKTARAVARRIALCVRLGGNSATPENAAQLDQIATTMAKLSPAVDDFVTSLYPPVNRPSATQSAGVLLQCLQALLQLIRSSHCAGEGGELCAEWVNFLLGASNHNASKVLAAASPVQSAAT